MNNIIIKKKTVLLIGLLGIVIYLTTPIQTYAQYTVKWMAVGSLHNWYSEIGSEIEHGNLKVQQCGMQWPAIYNRQDMQAAKGFWIGCKNFTDEKGDNYPYKVVHVGPRVTGSNEFFPVKFEMYSRFEPPRTSVDLIDSYEKRVENDGVDPTLKPDRMIINITNSQVGITMTRKIMQFSHPYHDNYIICDYTFTNTGNVDDDAEIELPNQTLEDVYFYFQYRWAVSFQTRYLIGNATGWGINLMLDSRGDGVMEDPPNEQFRAQFGWHGKYPPFTQYDNIGAPIWDPAGSAGYIGVADTVGRLGAAQFIGVVTLHADKSPTDSTDDPNQPSTTSYEGSDQPNTSQNDPYNVARMESEYEWMSKGHVSPRHAWKVEPNGNFTEPSGDPALGTPGGFSACNGYGPYTLGPGESIRIVWAEGAAGLSREKCIEIGKQFKKGEISAKTKNEWVLSGRDSLFQTFRRAIANFTSDYSIQQPPKPPSAFRVNGGGDRIILEWDVYETDPNLTGFDIYRAKGQYDSTYQLIHTAGPDERNYNDTVLERGVSYYYYIASLGGEIPANPSLNIPRDILKSSRYYTQTYDPTSLKRPAGESLSQIRVVPNPYNISADPNRLLFPGEADKLAFYNIPGQCTIKIYTEIGELVKTIEHTDGSGDAYWSCTTEYQQIVVSGLYIAVVTDNESGKSQIVKFLIIR